MSDDGPSCPVVERDRADWPGDGVTKVPAPTAATNRLDRPIDVTRDHLLGPENAPITLVEYGSYACPYCRAANERISQVRGQLGDRLRYVFRHRPILGSELARPAAEHAESAADHAGSRNAHVTLMTGSPTLTESDLKAVAETLGLTRQDPDWAAKVTERARRRVDQDVESARASGVHYTPTFFINGRRYDGPWDESSFADAMLGTLGHRVRTAASNFATWAPSAGVLLLLATIPALFIANSPLGPGFQAFWHTELGIAFGGAGFRLPLSEWINDALLTVSFLVVGLEIKREVSHRQTARFRSGLRAGGPARPCQ